jgi:hypothetical protein
MQEALGELKAKQEEEAAVAARAAALKTQKVLNLLALLVH